MKRDELKYKKAVFELYCWQYSNTGCFNNMLFDLIAKADFKNRNKLMLLFYYESLAFNAWREADRNGDELFIKHNLMKESEYE